MKKFLLPSLSAFMLSGVLMSQTVLFEDSFETYNDFIIDNVGDWTLINVDQGSPGSPADISYANINAQQAYIVFNSNTTSPPIGEYNDTFDWDWSARTGEKAMMSIYRNTTANNAWLISPPIELESVDNTLSFWIKSASAYYSENYNVLISTTGTNISDFTLISSGATTLPHIWEEVSLNLDSYANQTVYVAIQCVSNDKFGFLVDDFSVTTSELGLANVQNQDKLVVYPNPVKDLVYINSKETLTNAELFNLAGQKINGIKINSENNSINLSHLPNGVYVLKIKINNQLKTNTLIKK